MTKTTIKSVLVLPLCMLIALVVSSAQGQNRTFTTDADFDEGVLANVNHDAPNNDQLQLNRGTASFPFVNIAASARGTAVRAHTETGVVTGEYFTAPNGMGRDPSRTTVDQLGNTWVGNRAEGGFVPAPVNQVKGSLTRIGLILGGTRTDASGTPDPTGQFLMGPFDYNTCQDRHGATVGTPPDGLIKTSTGLGNILPWTNSGAADSFGGVSTAEDECIINYVRAGSPNTRTITIDSNNDVWVGGTGNRQHQKVDGVTGQPVAGTEFVFGCGGYGGFIDGNGVLWSMTSGSSYLRFDTNTMTGACRPLNNYGTGVDPSTGEIWITQLSGNVVHKVAPDGTLLGSFPHGNYYAQGVVVDGEGNVWVAHSLFSATTVGHLKTDGTFIGNVALPGGNGPTGVAVDAAGKVWVANINSNNAMRIDPDGGPIGADGVTPVGAVDLTVNLGAGAGPYNYSDMTGSVVAGVTAPQGTWTVVHDGGSSGVNWSAISWTGDEPAGTSITVKARAADVEADLAGEAYVDVTNGGALAGLSGRYVQVQATLTRSGDVNSPILYDLTVAAEDIGPVDAVAPECVIQRIAAGPPTQLFVRVQDGLSGLGSIVVLQSKNADTVVPPFAPGTTDPVVVTATKIVQSKSAVVALRVTDVAGNSVTCDPVLTTIASEIPEQFGLEQSYPNPFNPTTQIRFHLAESGSVSLKVYDVGGREVAVLVNQQLSAGTYEATWDGTDAAGNTVASGLYLYRLETPGFSQTRSVTFMK